MKSLLPFLAALLLGNPAPAADAPALYTQHCASCHGASRLGGMGPALLPESLERLKRKDAVATIRDGRAATQMPAFAATLSATEIDALAGWIYSPVSPAPAWSEADIRASRTEPFPPGSLPDARQGDVAKADPMNLFIVVEAGDHHVSVLDGDRMERIHRFPSRYALHGGPKFTPDGRYVFFASRDGWVSKFDIWNLKVVAEVRAGLNARNAAVSSDGRYVAVANYLPGNLVIFDADLKLLKVAKAASSSGKYAYVLPNDALYKRVTHPMSISKMGLSTGFQSINFSGNMVVIKTRPGYASSIAYNIDNSDIPQILGTIAGDDTIFLVKKKGTTEEEIIDILSEVIPELNHRY